ncbi:MAG TPA: nucleotidyltransferase family protein [Thermoanaerobaculia bacterium]|nr:nucleotidyltransferase family protein [Thermoanaerobaculia bacterium]
MPRDEGEPRRAVAGVVLAAGSSTRMGENKLLIDLDGEALVARAVRRAMAAGLGPVIVVLGHEADRVARALEGVPCRLLVNAHHRSGQGSSFRSGIAAVPEDAAAAVVLLADMPMVTADMIAAVVDLYGQTGAPLVLSEYAGVSAPPTLYDRSLFPEIAAGDGCGRQIVERHRGRARSVAWPAERLADLDEPADLERFRADERCAPIS